MEFVKKDREAPTPVHARSSPLQVINATEKKTSVIPLGLCDFGNHILSTTEILHVPWTGRLLSSH